MDGVAVQPSAVLLGGQEQASVNDLRALTEELGGSFIEVGDDDDATGIMRETRDTDVVVVAENDRAETLSGQDPGILR